MTSRRSAWSHRRPTVREHRHRSSQGGRRGRPRGGVASNRLPLKDSLGPSARIKKRGGKRLRAARPTSSAICRARATIPFGVETHPRRRVRRFLFSYTRRVGGSPFSPSIFHVMFHVSVSLYSFSLSLSPSLSLSLPMSPRVVAGGRWGPHAWRPRALC